MKKSLLAVAILATASGIAQADIIGLTGGAYVWKQSWDGDVRSGPSANDEISVQDDLGYDDDTGSSFFIAIEHPVPLIPNIRLQRSEMEISEKATLSRTFSFEGKTYTAGDDIDSTTDLSHTDATFYYEILDNWVNLDIGFSVRVFDGEVRLKTNSFDESLDLDAPLPMAYANARFDLPFSGLYAAAVGNVIAFDGNSVTDITMGVGYEIGIAAIELNYRNFDVSLEDDDEEAGITVDGVFLGVVIDI